MCSHFRLPTLIAKYITWILTILLHLCEFFWCVACCSSNFSPLHGGGGHGGGGYGRNDYESSGDDYNTGSYSTGHSYTDYYGNGPTETYEYKKMGELPLDQKTSSDKSGYGVGRYADKAVVTTPKFTFATPEGEFMDSLQNILPPGKFTVTGLTASSDGESSKSTATTTDSQTNASPPQSIKFALVPMPSSPSQRNFVLPMLDVDDHGSEPYQ